MNGRLTRRDLLERSAAGLAVASLPGFFASEAFAASAAGIDPAKLGKTLTISNWPLYIDVDEKTKKRPTIEQYQRKYKVKVKYIEDINDNATFFGKIQGALSHGQPTGRDIIVMTDGSRFPSLLVKKGWVEKIDYSVAPNLKNLVATQRHPAWDPKREYSMPWQSGMTGIGYNAKLTKPITSIDQLLTDKKLHGKVTLLSEMSDTIGLVMLSNGDDPGKVTDAAFNKALAKVQKAIKSGQVRQFTGNDYASLMSKGDVIAATVWSGDMVQLHADNKNLQFTVPQQGGMIWTDNMLIPKGGNAYGASVFMNFVYDPKIAAQIEDYVNYVCPVSGADKELLKTDPEVAKDTLIFPTKAMRAKLHQIDPNALFNADYLNKWQKLLGA
jgi:spermidine/putrescine transport system substrate-binding protein